MLLNLYKQYHPYSISLFIRNVVSLYKSQTLLLFISFCCLFTILGVRSISQPLPANTVTPSTETTALPLFSIHSMEYFQETDSLFNSDQTAAYKAPLNHEVPSSYKKLSTITNHSNNQQTRKTIDWLIEHPNAWSVATIQETHNNTVTPTLHLGINSKPIWVKITLKKQEGSIPEKQQFWLGTHIPYASSVTAYQRPIPLSPNQASQPNYGIQKLDSSIIPISEPSEIWINIHSAYPITIEPTILSTQKISDTTQHTSTGFLIGAYTVLLFGLFISDNGLTTLKHSASTLLQKPLSIEDHLKWENLTLIAYIILGFCISLLFLNSAKAPNISQGEQSSHQLYLLSICSSLALLLSFYKAIISKQNTNQLSASIRQEEEVTQHWKASLGALFGLVFFLALIAIQEKISLLLVSGIQLLIAGLLHPTSHLQRYKLPSFLLAGLTKSILGFFGFSLAYWSVMGSVPFGFSFEFLPYLLLCHSLLLSYEISQHYTAILYEQSKPQENTHSPESDSSTESLDLPTSSDSTQDINNNTRNPLIDSLQSAWNLKTLHLHKWVEQNLLHWESLAHTQKRQLVFSTHPSTPANIINDQQKLTLFCTTFINLALKHSTTGNLSIRITSSEGNTFGHKLKFSIQDTHSSLPAPLQEIVNLSDFSSKTAKTDCLAEDSDRKESEKLLPILTEIHSVGGNTGVKVDQTYGASYHFTLPTIADLTPVENQPLTDILTSHKLLLMTYDADYGITMAEQANVAEINMNLALSTRQAMRNLKQSDQSAAPYDSILVDFSQEAESLPGFVAEIREIDSYRETPIIILTQPHHELVYLESIFKHRHIIIRPSYFPQLAEQVSRALVHSPKMNYCVIG